MLLEVFLDYLVYEVPVLIHCKVVGWCSLDLLVDCLFYLLAKQDRWLVSFRVCLSLLVSSLFLHLLVDLLNPDSIWHGFLLGVKIGLGRYEDCGFDWEVVWWVALSLKL